jgi:trk system potassium uptake protein TrkH
MQRGLSSTIDLQPVLFIVGLLLTALAGVMLLPAIANILLGHSDWRAFVFAAAATLFVGGALAFVTYRERPQLGLRQAFLVTTLCWLTTAVFAALPFMLMATPLSFTDAFFEAMSGITTTGATVMVGLDRTPPGILLWRGLLQWLGGIGIIVTAVAILPMLQVGGMQLFRTESSDRSQKAMPRTAQIAAWIMLVYLGITVLLIVALWAAGMSLFEAMVHAMTTISTGGFSTSDSSIGSFNNPVIDWIVIVGMIAGALPFALYVTAVRGRPRLLVGDTQVQWFFGTLLAAALAILAGQMAMSDQDFWVALRLGLFNTTSILTGTGYASADYNQWGSFAQTIFFILTLIGGCAGSASCGIKIFRFQILFGAANLQIKKLVQPHGVFIAYYNRNPISQGVVDSVMAFILVYMAGLAILTTGLSFLGLDILTAASGAATCISNVGPGLGDIIGPAGTFTTLPDAAKWLLSAGMLFGRLEFFTILVLFAPGFWRD